jgi:hypothetical protein
MLSTAAEAFVVCQMAHSSDDSRQRDLSGAA